MSATSVIPTVRKALVTIFGNATASVTGPGVTVYLSDQTTETNEDALIIGGAMRKVDRLAFVGNDLAGAFIEHIRLTFDIHTTVYGSSPFPAADDRAYEILDLCEQAIRQDPTLGGLVLEAQLSEVSSEHAVDENACGMCDIIAVLEIVNPN